MNYDDLKTGELLELARQPQHQAGARAALNRRAIQLLAARVRGGSATTPAKRRAVRDNGRKGGRPRSKLTQAERAELRVLESGAALGFLSPAGRARFAALLAKKGGRG